MVYTLPEAIYLLQYLQRCREFTCCWRLSQGRDHKGETFIFFNNLIGNKQLLSEIKALMSCVQSLRWLGHELPAALCVWC